MKTLYLLRHAKSGWHDASLRDHDRPLEPRGERDAAKMGQRWAHQHIKPELIIASSAVRTQATAQIVADELAYKAEDILTNERLYAATPETLLAVIEALDDSLSRVMLVAHNPGLTELAHHFDRKIHDMPTCALVEFKFDTDSWAAIGQARPLHTHFDSPKD